MLNKKFLPYTLLVVSHSVFAVQLPGADSQMQQLTTIPSAGSQMQQLPRVPVQQNSVPNVEVQQGVKPVIPKPEGIKIIVKQLKISGAPVYSEAQLLRVTGFKPGSELSLSDLRGMATKIADYYHNNGFFVAQAYLPAQDVKNGVVTIAVITGQYGNITLNNKTNLSNSLAKDLLGGLNKGDPVKSGPLESRLLLLSDLPGVRINSTLVPGASVGTSDLIVDVKQGPRLTGSIDADNAGNRYTGAYRGGATFFINNLSGHGDFASLRVLTSGPGLNYGRASYQMQFGKASAGVAYSYLEYHLGEQYASLDAYGSQQIASIYVSYPLLRTRNNSLHVLLDYDEKIFQDKLGSVPSTANKRAHVLRTSLYGDHHDNFGGGGFDAYSLTLSSGFIDLQNAQVRNIDATTARTNGYFTKLAFYANRQQNLNETFSLYTSIYGQWASKNLDVSEKMELGGMYAVRAYPEGEAYGDEGFVFTVEPRMRLPKFSERMPGQMQLIGFIDTGTIITNTNSWAGWMNNRRTLSGAGVGLNWTVVNNFFVRGYYAHKLGSGEALSAPDRSGRLWIQAVKYF